MQWFGPKPFAPVCEPDAQRPTPVGQSCAWCDESIEGGDRGFLMAHIDEHHVASRRPWHLECFLRTISGSVAHVEKRCSCFGGKDAENDTELSKREEAKLAVHLWGDSPVPWREA